jgi:phenylacetate-coenzyme A ligase PaaK-like adenylate-forming protein
MRAYYNKNTKAALMKLLKTLPKDDFYKHKVSGLKFHKKNLISLGDFYKIPFATKEELCSFQNKGKKSQQDNSFIMRVRADNLGNELKLPLSFDDYRGMVEFEQYRLEKAGIKTSDVCSIVYFPLQHIIPMAEAIMRIGAKYVPIEGGLEQRVSKIFDYELTCLLCTPKTVNDLIDYAKITKEKSSLRLIITAGQKIADFKDFSLRVKKFLGAEVIDQIGSSELQIFATHCKQHEQYHLIDKNQVVEIIDPETQKSSEKGELVITPLWRKDYPLIRYRTGDYIELKKRIKCRCGIQDPRVFGGVIKRVGGLTKVNGVLVSLDEISDNINKSLNYQYPLDKIIWSNISPPHILTIISEENRNDHIKIYLSRKKYQLTLRRRRPIEDYLDSFFGITPMLILVDSKDIKEMSDYQYLDIRGQKKSDLPKNVRVFIKKYD